jgi:hypothetical protein
MMEKLGWVIAALVILYLIAEPAPVPVAAPTAQVDIDWNGVRVGAEIPLGARDNMATGVW